LIYEEEIIPDQPESLLKGDEEVDEWEESSGCCLSWL